MIEQAERNYARNRHYHERQKLIDRIRLYADRPDFVAKLKRELQALEQAWKDRKLKRVRRLRAEYDSLTPDWRATYLRGLNESDKRAVLNRSDD